MRDVIAAFAPVAGPLMQNGDNERFFEADPFLCQPRKPVPLLHFHHIKDPIVPFNGSPVLGFPSIPDSPFLKGSAISTRLEMMWKKNVLKMMILQSANITLVILHQVVYLYAQLTTQLH